jgi:nitric oxide reductase large subunit
MSFKQTDIISIYNSRKTIVDIYNTEFLSDYEYFNINEVEAMAKNNQLDTSNTPLSKTPLTRETELIKRPETQYIYTNNSDYLPGVINPLNKRIITNKRVIIIMLMLIIIVMKIV